MEDSCFARENAIIIVSISSSSEAVRASQRQRHQVQQRHNPVCYFAEDNRLKKRAKYYSRGQETRIARGSEVES